MLNEIIPLASQVIDTLALDKPSIALEFYTETVKKESLFNETKQHQTSLHFNTLYRALKARQGIIISQETLAETQKAIDSIIAKSAVIQMNLKKEAERLTLYKKLDQSIALNLLQRGTVQIVLNILSGSATGLLAPAMIYSGAFLLRKVTTAAVLIQRKRVNDLLKQEDNASQFQLEFYKLTAINVIHQYILSLENQHHDEAKSFLESCNQAIIEATSIDVVDQYLRDVFIEFDNQIRSATYVQLLKNIVKICDERKSPEHAENQKHIQKLQAELDETERKLQLYRQYKTESVLKKDNGFLGRFGINIRDFDQEEKAIITHCQRKDALVEEHYRTTIQGLRVQYIQNERAGTLTDVDKQEFQQKKQLAERERNASVQCNAREKQKRLDKIFCARHEGEKALSEKIIELRTHLHCARKSFDDQVDWHKNKLAELTASKASIEEEMAKFDKVVLETRSKKKLKIALNDIETALVYHQTTLFQLQKQQLHYNIKCKQMLFSESRLKQQTTTQMCTRSLSIL